MGIDGIGGGRPPIGPTGGAAGPAKTSGEGFSLDRDGASAELAHSSVKTEASPQIGSTADLERLQSGAISLDDYLQTRADQAVAHLASALSKQQLDVIKERLVLQMKQDPTVAALVHRATGILPANNEG